MKTNPFKSFLTIAIITSALLTGRAEDSREYKPILTAGKSWLMAECQKYGNTAMDVHFVVEVKGDTIFDVISCKHLERYYIGREAERTSLFAYELDGKFYHVYRHPESGIIIEDLLMDFSMKPGNSHTVLVDGKDIGFTQMVREERYANVNGVDYRMLYVGPGLGFTGPFGYWVEGVGASATNIATPDAIGADKSTPYITNNVMICCYQDGNPIFDHLDYNGYAHYYPRNYSRILTPGKSWLIGAVRSSSGDELKYLYSVGKDTIIGDNHCQIIDFLNVDDPKEKGRLTACEINGRVFKVADEHNLAPGEQPGTLQPILDIAVPVYGSNLHSYDYRTGLPLDPTGEGEFSYEFSRQTIDNRNHREIVVDNGSTHKNCWVEGVGASIVDFCLTDFPSTSAIEDIDYRYLIACYQDGKCIFTQDDFSQPVAGIREIRTESADKNNAIYDLQGRRVTNPIPGRLYIRHGQKHIAH